MKTAVDILSLVVLQQLVTFRDVFQNTATELKCLDAKIKVLYLI